MSIITAAPDNYERAVNAYVSLLEKTNNQLGIGINLSSLSVTILSVLVAVISIVVAVYLWKNSREQRELFKNFLTESRKYIEEQSKIFIKQKELALDSVIKDLEKAKSSVIEDKKSELQKIIDEYREEKKELTTISKNIFSSLPIAAATTRGYLSPSYSSYSTNYPYGTEGIWNFGDSTQGMICSHCGKTFKYIKPNQESIYSTVTLASVYGAQGEKQVFCSYCGAKNIPQ